MSLDVYLTSPDGATIPTYGHGIFIRENGAMREITREEWDARFPDREPVTVRYESDYSDELYSRNITHNLGKMAEAAGIYQHLWRPEELGITTAAQLIEPLRAGLKRLEESPAEFKKHNPANGWGAYEGLVDFVREYLDACEKYPNAIVRASR